MVDLVGWTGSGFQQGFLHRLGPLQVNYLGYFASTANPEMDLWLGDRGLFPDPIQEWHSERIVRLNRPFLAWQPHDAFAEAHLAVTEAPSTGLASAVSTPTASCPIAPCGSGASFAAGSRWINLVLKANAGSDPSRSCCGGGCCIRGWIRSGWLGAVGRQP